MDAIVTARVPSGIKEQGRIALEKIGATPTDLVNAAYRYVLEEGKLPQTQEPAFRNATKPRKLSATQKRKLARQLKETTFAVPASFWKDRTDRELLEQALEEKYARAY